MPFEKGHKINIGNKFAKGHSHSPWNKGKHLSIETKKRISIAHIKSGIQPPVHRGKDSYKWKGNKVSYSGLHKWINRQLGKANLCSLCGEIGIGRKIQWANKDHKYSRNLIDWISLCVNCHKKYDKNMKEINQNYG